LHATSHHRLSKTVLLQNAEAVKSLSDLFKTCLGPRGLSKLVVGKDGIVYLTHDGPVILDKIGVSHPAVQVVLEGAKAIDEEFGDGTISVIVLCGAILGEASKLLLEGLKTATILRGLQLALNHIISSVPHVDVGLNDRAALESVANSALPGTLRGTRFARLAVEAATKITDKVGDRIDVDLRRIRFQRCVGGSADETRLVNGVVLLNEISHRRMPVVVRDARILVSLGELMVKPRGRTQLEASIRVNRPYTLSDFINYKAELMRELVYRISATGANVVVVEKGIDQCALQYLAEMGIMAIRRVVIEDIERIALATQARLTTDFRDLSPQCLGYASVVEEVKVAGKSWIFFDGCRNPKVVSFFIRGSGETFVSEIEGGLASALNAVKAVLEKPKIVGGGGAFEARLAANLRHYAVTIPGKESLAVLGVANALEEIPRVIALSAGFDVHETLAELRSRKEAGTSWVGIDVMKRAIVDVLAEGIIDPLAVKEAVVKASLEIAKAIIRIDETVISRQLYGKERQMKEREAYLESSRVKKIKREYGIE